MIYAMLMRFYRQIHIGFLIVIMRWTLLLWRAHGPG